MASMQERMIESLIKDLDNIKSLDDHKVQRKEYSLILQRIESAKKLISNDKNLLSILLELELNIQNLKAIK